MRPVEHQGFALSANVSLLFGELPYLDRFAAARAAGFDLVETWWPFSTPTPSTQELSALLTAIDDADVELRGLNFFAGDMAGGERGIACASDRRGELEANVDAVVVIAEATGCRRFNLLHGQLAADPGAAPGAPPRSEWGEAQQATAVEAYRLAAAAVDAVGGVVLVEPLAEGLNGSYPLTDHRQVLALLDGPLAGVGNIGLLYDTFHLGSNGIDLVAAAAEAGSRIQHVQVADTPGRGEPGSGRLEWPPIFAALQRAGYTGPVAAEYKPTGPTTDTLTWIDRQPAPADTGSWGRP